MKYFYLGHGNMSLTALKYLLEKNKKPEFAVIHKSLDREKLQETFYTPFKELCKQYDVPLYETDGIIELKDEIAKCDTGLCAGFMEIIKPEVFNLPKHGILNLHCGKLPEYRGRAPISRTIIDGKSHLTASLHKIDKGVDSGDVLIEYDIEIYDSDDVNTLYNKCEEEAGKILAAGLYLFEKGKPKFKSQNIPEGSKANGKITETERVIDWSKSANEVYNKIRGLTPPYPGALTYLDSREIIIAEAEVTECRNEAGPGTINDFFGDKIVNCGTGCLSLTKITDIEGKEIKLSELTGIFS